MIVSSGNPKVKDMRAARRCKDDRALVEGPHLVAEALARGLELEIVVATEHFLESAAARRLVASLPRRPLSIAPEVLDELLDSDSPRGIAAVVRLADADPLAIPPWSVAVYADGLQDPGNLGAVARSAEAAGAGALVIGPGCARPNHPRALRASTGSLLRLPRWHAAGGELEGPLGEVRWLALDGSATTSIYDVDVPERFVLAVGSEAHGLSDAVRGRADDLVSIPLAGAVESLNAAVAAGIALFELRRRREDLPKR